jgi:hypothetical protein
LLLHCLLLLKCSSISIRNIEEIRNDQTIPRTNMIQVGRNFLFCFVLIYSYLIKHRYTKLCKRMHAMEKKLIQINVDYAGIYKRLIILLDSTISCILPLYKNLPSSLYLHGKVHGNLLLTEVMFPTALVSLTCYSNWFFYSILTVSAEWAFKKLDIFSPQTAISEL